MSLAKYLWIAAGEDDPALDVHDVPAFFRHVLERVDWPRDLHFQTCTTIDTLDYSGGALNEGSKVVIAAAGPAAAAAADGDRLAATCPTGFGPAAGLPAGRAGRRRGRVTQPTPTAGDAAIETFLRRIAADGSDQPLSADRGRRRREFAARTLDNFLWVTFTRSNPAADVYGIEPFTRPEALGLPRLAGDRRPHEAAPRAAAGRRSGSDAPRRRAGRRGRTAGGNHLSCSR